MPLPDFSTVMRTFKKNCYIVTSEHVSLAEILVNELRIFFLYSAMWVDEPETFTEQFFIFLSRLDFRDL